MTDRRIRWPDPSFGDEGAWLDGETLTNGLGQEVVRLKIDVGSSTITITTGLADSAPFTAAVDAFAPIGGVNDPDMADVPDGDAGAAKITPKRALHVNLRDAADNELGVATALVIKHELAGKLTGKVSVDNAGELLLAANPDRKEGRLRNFGLKTVYLSAVNPATTDDYPLLAGGELLDTLSADAWYGICGGTDTSEVRTLEVS